MNKHSLFDLAQRGLVDRLDLLSLEGGIYLLEVHTGEERQMLRDEYGQVMKLRSIEDSKKQLRGIAKVPFFLVHASVYNEMCGLDSPPIMPLSVPITLPDPV